MKFKKYTSIENSYREKYIDILRELGHDKSQWVAHEKIDGANFSFITDGVTVQVASRQQLVDGSFYNCQSVIDKYVDKVLQLKQIHFASADQIQVYGELFGQGIQNRIFYGDGKEFMAFDIAADGVIVGTAELAGLLDYVGIPQAPFIGRYDNLDDALRAEPVFISKVVDLLNPEDKVCQYELGENDAEGLVLKPTIALYTPNGSRVIIKNKNEAFTEKNKRKEKKPSEPNPFIPVVEQYVNENRMNAVISKEGELTPKDFGRIIGLMGEDVINDMIKDDDLPEDWKKQDEFKLAGKAVSKVVAAFLKKNLLPKI